MGVTALMCACVRGEDVTTRVLLKHRADMTLCDNHGLSPLHCAAWGGSLKCVKQLVTHNNRALLTLRDQWGRSALLAAAAKVFDKDMPSKLMASPSSQARQGCQQGSSTGVLTVCPQGNTTFSPFNSSANLESFGCHILLYINEAHHNIVCVAMAASVVFNCSP